MTANLPAPPRRFWWIALGLAIVLTVIFLLLRHRGDPLAAYTKLQPTRGDLEVTVLSTGAVSPENRLSIKPPVAGRIEEIFVTEGQTVEKGSVLARMSAMERATLLDLSSTKGEKARNRFSDFYRTIPLYAPMTATIIRQAIKYGQIVSPEDTLFLLSNRLIVRAQVDETDIGQVYNGQYARLTLDAYPDAPIDGTVTHIANDATVINNVTYYTVDILPTQSAPFLRSGMTTNVDFLIARRSNILLLPNTALTLENATPIVFTLSADGERVATPIVTGLSNGRVTEIVSGISQTDTVLVPRFTRSGQAGATSPFIPLKVDRN